MCNKFTEFIPKSLAIQSNFKWLVAIQIGYRIKIFGIMIRIGNSGSAISPAPPDNKDFNHGWTYYKHTYIHIQTVSVHKKQISHGWIDSNCILMDLGTFCCHVWYCETMSALLTSGTCQHWEWGANKRKYETHTHSHTQKCLALISAKPKYCPQKVFKTAPLSG